MANSVAVMPPFHTDHESHELINVRIRDDSWNIAIFLSNRDALRFCYDTGTT